MKKSELRTLIREELSKLNEGSRPIFKIVNDIIRDWVHIDHYARLYLNSMSDMNDINSTYDGDSARKMITGFLKNADSWKGATATAIKKELTDMLK